MHRWGPTWPPGVTPQSVRWRTNATVVTISYHASLSYLRSLPGKIVDLVVYHKADLGKPNVSYEPMTAEYVLSHLKEQELCTPTTGATATALRSNWFSTRLHHPARTCPVGCKCGKRPLAERPRLQYFAVLPNYGQQYKAPYGGSREPYGYLQFILDFWHNLPNVIIFSQDDCLARGCAWGNALPQLGMRLSNWRSEWGFRAAPTSRNCLCKFIRETNYRSRGYFWYRWMAFLEEGVWNSTRSVNDSMVTWPQDATFAVGAPWVRAQPYWMYEALVRLLTVENMCMRAGTIMWAHSMERLWFELLDQHVRKPPQGPPHAVLDAAHRSQCLLAVRRRK